MKGGCDALFFAFSKQKTSRRRGDWRGRSNPHFGGINRVSVNLQKPVDQSGRDDFCQDHQREFGDLEGGATGSITVYLSLFIIILLAFLVSLIESASLNMAKNYSRIDVNSGLESVFAEYQQNLLEEYSILALESTYESGVYDEEKISARLAYFAGGRTDYRILERKLLTDNRGAPFIHQGVQYGLAKYGLSGVEIPGTNGTYQDIEAAGKDALGEERELFGSLENILSENEITLTGENNPLDKLLELQGQSLLGLLLPKETSVSAKSFAQAEKLPSRRNLQAGNMATNSSDGIERLPFTVYLQDHFGEFTSGEQGKALTYEQEYLLAGEVTDEDNLQEVVGSLLGIRFGLNYLYIQTDGGKKAEAKALAATVAGLVQLPLLTEVLSQGILLAWSYGEGIMDVRTLLAGNRVALFKTRDTWQLQLMGLFSLGTDGDVGAGEDDQRGLSYGDYLQILLSSRRPETLAMRALDLIERNMALKGKSFIQVDQLYCGLKISSISTLRRGITYAYNCEYEYR